MLKSLPLECFKSLIDRKHEIAIFFVIFYGILLTTLLQETFQIGNINNILLINLSPKMIKNGIFNKYCKLQVTTNIFSMVFASFSTTVEIVKLFKWKNYSEQQFQRSSSVPFSLKSFVPLYVVNNYQITFINLKLYS